MTSCIAVNIGNTRISCALVSGAEVDRVQYYLLSEVDRASDHLIDLTRTQNVSSISLCSVVPAVKSSLLDRLNREEIESFDITYENQRVIAGLYQGIGADRIADLAAAYRIYAKDRAAVVLDFGTATTMSAVSATGEFLGGLITLGLGKTFAALHHATAQLPDLQKAFEAREPVVFGKNTHDAIVSGCLLGHTGGIKHWIELAKNELGDDVTVIATGGYSQDVLRRVSVIDHHDPYLVFKGIGVIAEARLNGDSKG